MQPTHILELIIRSLPYPSEIRDINMEADAVLFSWRSMRFRVSTMMLTETVGDGALISDDASLLLFALIQREYARTGKYFIDQRYNMPSVRESQPINETISAEPQE
jgi:hypothetical protein